MSLKGEIYKVLVADEIYSLFLEKGGAIAEFEDMGCCRNDVLVSCRVMAPTIVEDISKRETMLNDIRDYVGKINLDLQRKIRPTILLRNLEKGEILMITKPSKFQIKRYIIFAGVGNRTVQFKLNTMLNIYKLNKYVFDKSVITGVVAKWTGDAIVHKINFEKLLVITNNNRVYGL